MELFCLFLLSSFSRLPFLNVERFDALSSIDQARTTHYNDFPRYWLTGSKRTKSLAVIISALFSKLSTLNCQVQLVSSKDPISRRLGIHLEFESGATTR